MKDQKGKGPTPPHFQKLQRTTKTIPHRLLVVFLSHNTFFFLYKISPHLSSLTSTRENTKQTISRFAPCRSNAEKEKEREKEKKTLVLQSPFDSYTSIQIRRRKREQNVFKLQPFQRPRQLQIAVRRSHVSEAKIYIREETTGAAAPGGSRLPLVGIVFAGVVPSRKPFDCRLRGHADASGS